VNKKVGSQGTVLLSVRCGFTFAIAAEIVLRDPLQKEIQRAAHSFFTAGSVSVATVGVGIFDTGRRANPKRSQPSAAAFHVFQSVAVLLFIIALTGLLELRSTGANLHELFTTLGLVMQLSPPVATTAGTSSMTSTSESASEQPPART
jgi:hypothetical protein